MSTGTTWSAPPPRPSIWLKSASRRGRPTAADRVAARRAIALALMSLPARPCTSASCREPAATRHVARRANCRGRPGRRTALRARAPAQPPTLAQRSSEARAKSFCGSSALPSPVSPGVERCLSLWRSLVVPPDQYLRLARAPFVSRCLCNLSTTQPGLITRRLRERGGRPPPTGRGA